MKPSGGTELQHNFLEQHVSKDLLDKFQICTSVPGKVPLSKDKVNILWQKILIVIGTMNNGERLLIFLMKNAR